MDLATLRRTVSDDVRLLNPEVFEVAEKHKGRHNNKYNATRIVVDGMTFDSKGEYRRWLSLTRLQDGGAITDLQRQVKFVLQDAFVDSEGKKHRPICYRADFVYQEGGFTIIEDYKSKITAKGEAFRIRWRMLCERFKDDNTVRLAIVY